MKLFNYDVKNKNAAIARGVFFFCLLCGFTAVKSFFLVFPVIFRKPHFRFRQPRFTQCVYPNASAKHYHNDGGNGTGQDGQRYCRSSFQGFFVPCLLKRLLNCLKRLLRTSLLRFRFVPFNACLNSLLGIPGCRRFFRAFL
jgi:hypothetical protein